MISNFPARLFLISSESPRLPGYNLYLSARQRPLCSLLTRNWKREFCFDNSVKYTICFLLSLSLSLSLSLFFLCTSRTDLIHISFLTSDRCPRERRLAGNPFAREIYERSTSPRLDRTADTGARISSPCRGCLTSRNLCALSTARPRYPSSILFNLSLSLYRICPVTARRETKSILYPGSANRLYMFPERAAVRSPSSRRAEPSFGG